MAGEQNPIRLALVDPLSLAGKELRRALDDSGLALADVQLFGREDAAGTIGEFGGEPRLVQRLGPDTLEPADAVIFCGGGDLIAPALPWLDELGTTVVDLTGTLPLEPGTRLIVPGSALPGVQRLRVRHPASRVLATLLGSLGESLSLLRAEATVFEPVAAAGAGGIDELHEQTRELLSFREPPTAVLGRRIAFNLAPLWGEARERLERRLAEEVRSSLADTPPFQVTVVQAGIFLGLAVVLSVEVDEDLDPDVVREMLCDDRHPELVAAGEPATPGDLSDDGGEAIRVTVLVDGGSGHLRLWAVSDYLRGPIAEVVALLRKRFA